MKAAGGYYNDTFTTVLRDIIFALLSWLGLGLVVLGAAALSMWLLGRKPLKPQIQRYPRWHLPQDRAIKVVEKPYDQEHVNEVTSDIFDWAEWEEKYSGSGHGG